MRSLVLCLYLTGCLAQPQPGVVPSPTAAIPTPGVATASPTAAASVPAAPQAARVRTVTQCSQAGPLLHVDVRPADGKWPVGAFVTVDMLSPDRVFGNGERQITAVQGSVTYTVPYVPAGVRVQVTAYQEGYYPASQEIETTGWLDDAGGKRLTLDLPPAATSDYRAKALPDVYYQYILSWSC